MKESTKPHKIVDNAKEFNLTEEHLTDFVNQLDQWLLENGPNKTFTSTNTTNVTRDEANQHQIVSCDDFCDSQMRHCFDVYKQYHGYVTLVVSLLRLREKIEFRVHNDMKTMWINCHNRHCQDWRSKLSSSRFKKSNVKRALITSVLASWTWC